MTEQFVDITADAPATRWFAGPPGWIFGALVAANVALTVVAYAGPGRFLVPWLVCAAGWIALGLSAVARIGLAVAQRGRRGAVGMRWLLVGAVVAGTAGAVFTGVPVRAGLQLAKPDMMRYAAGADTPARVGPYPVERAERLPGGGARFMIAGTGFLDGSGFAYAPDGVPPRIGEDTYRQLSDGWYLWTESW
ncbi:hypothetical protein [Catenuloplanes japonicus]|uniref:hypothetical protein n=1 Tax=Catenuloplanes japonicus TaxID=33876 RepID=UPI000AE9454B|nr:hypothetical protein [Catenuloplanes japonicus]